MYKISLLLGISGTLAVVLGVYYFARTAFFLTHGVKTQGVVVSVQRSSRTQGRGGDVLIYLNWKIEFSAATGKKYEFYVSAASGFVLQPKVGDAINVYYDPSDPAHAQLGTFYQMWFIPILLTLAGMSLLFWLKGPTKN